MENNNNYKGFNLVGGNNYNKYRPPYPSYYIEKIRKVCEEEKALGKAEDFNYLDLGCGTGQIFFRICDIFTNVVADDISFEQANKQIT